MFFLTPNRFGILTAAVLSVATLSYMPLAHSATWQPKASEKLVKMPASYLKRAIDRDFANSDLAAALTNLSEDLVAKKQSLEDLQQAGDLAKGELNIELRHQHLAEKQAYIKLMGERQTLQRQQATTQISLYQRMLEKLERDQVGTTAQSLELQDMQQKAKTRFKAISNQVDAALFADHSTKPSKYATEYSKNAAALTKLAQAIQNHPMNKSPILAGEELSKQDYLRRLIQQEESELALLDQKDELLGYMAKLVALDAMALADEVEEQQMMEAGHSPEQGKALEPSDNIALFLN